MLFFLRDHSVSEKYAFFCKKYGEILIRHTILYCPAGRISKKNNAGLKKLRSETVTMVQGVSSPLHLLPDNRAFTFKATVKQAGCHSVLWNSETVNLEKNACIPEELVHFRKQSVPYRLWSDTILATVGCIPHSSNTRQARNKCPRFSTHADYIKFSNQYYVYTLEHILI